RHSGDSRRRRRSVRGCPQDRGLDLPLHAALAGCRAVHRYRAHAATAWLVSHQPGVELAGLAGREAEQQIELPRCDGVRLIDALVADHEMTVLGGAAGEGAVCGEVPEKLFRQLSRALPGLRTLL